MYPEPYPQQPYPPQPYPGALPPPVQYPKRGRKTWLIVAAVVAALAVVIGVIATVAASGTREQTAGGALTEASAKAAIQDYLDALTNGDDERVARHTLCGLFDSVKERRSDLALANLSSDAFRKQYESAQVSSIDKMVLSSPTQAQVLFTMRVLPASGSSRNAPTEADEQAVAQLLSIDDEVLVCSYLPRTAGQY